MSSALPKLVYVCHPFKDDPPGNASRVRSICRQVTRAGAVPMAPQVYLPQFMDDATQREAAMAACLRLLRTCDEVWVYGHDLTSGMREELSLAADVGIPVLFAGKALIVGLKP